MDEITQTSKAILFEEFRIGDEVPALNTLLDMTGKNEDDTEAVATPNFAAQVEETLGVRSFAEFLEKFNPKIYEYDGLDEAGNPITNYTTNEKLAKRLPGVREVNLTDNTYYKMLVEMYSKKGSSNQSNWEFDDKDILRILSPERELKEAKTIRKNLAYVEKEMWKAYDANEDTSPYKGKIIQYRRQIASKYQSSPAALIPLAIDDVKTKIQALLPGAGSSDGGDSVPLLQGGQLAFDETGELKLLEGPAEDNNEQDNVSEHQDNIAGWIEADYDATIGADGNPFVKSLMVDVYAPQTQSQSLMNLSEEERMAQVAVLRDHKNKYETYYARTKDNFIKTVTELAEKVIGVKVFFDNATAGSGNSSNLESLLIVTNCKPSDLVEDSRLPKFKSYIKNIGLEKGSKKCWFGILPGVAYDAAADDAQNSVDDINQGLNFKKKAPEHKTHAGDCLNLQVAKQILSVLDEGHILTTFNISTEDDESNSFDTITPSSIREKKERFHDWNFDHAVYAYPNFMLMRIRRVDATESEKIMVPNFYIDAAYPAAGLLVASQQISSLKARGFGDRLITDMDNMNCVRIDLEDPSLSKGMSTHFNRENIMNWSQGVMNAIQEDRFGFAFCGNEIYGDLQNSYVLTARVLKKMKNKQYKPIYRVLMQDFIYELVGSRLQKRKKMIDDVLLNKWVPEWQMAAKRFADDPRLNEMLQMGEKEPETIAWDPVKPNKLVIHFRTGDEVLDAVEIDDDENTGADK